MLILILFIYFCLFYTIQPIPLLLLLLYYAPDTNKKKNSNKRIVNV